MEEEPMEGEPMEEGGLDDLQLDDIVGMLAQLRPRAPLARRPAPPPARYVDELELLAVDLVGEYDIAEKRQQFNTLKQVPVCVARALLRGGQQVAAATIEIAKGGIFQRELPLLNTLKGTQAHLAWHQAQLDKLQDPAALYAPGEDLKKWVMQAFIDANAVEEGRAHQEQIWRAMWSDVGEAIASLPADAAKAVGQVARGLAQGIVSGAADGLGVPPWVLWAGGAAALGLAGLGVYKLVAAAAPVAVGVAARRYLP
jgi:hypothetical protein